MVGKKFRKTQRIRKTLRSCKDGRRRRRKTTPSIFSLLFFFQWHIFPFSQKNASLRLRLNSEKCVFVYFTGCCSPPPTTGSSKQLQFIYSFWSESSENVGEIITFFHVKKSFWIHFESKQQSLLIRAQITILLQSKAIL